MRSGIHIRHWPGDTDRPAIAVHCMMGNAAYWGPIARRLDGRIDLTGFDLPGHGRSHDWLREPGGPDYHTTVTRIAAGLLSRPVDLIGHSLGGTVALRIAVAAPEAVRSLTLIEPVLFAAAPDAAQARLDQKMALLLSQGKRAEAARAFLAVWGAQGYDDLPAPMQDQMQRQIELVAETGTTLNSDNANILRPGGLEAIDAPVMLISGVQSPPAVGAIADALAARLPDVGRASVPGAGHMLPITHPDAVAGLIEANLDRA